MKDTKNVVSNTIDYIENHLNDDIKLEEIAKSVGYSKFHLNRMFAECTGQTIHKYVRKRRLTKAAKSLVDTEKSIVEIAFEAGYDSQQSFTFAFRQVYYDTPLVYRESGVFHSRQSKIKMHLCSSNRRTTAVENIRSAAGKRVMAA